MTTHQPSEPDSSAAESVTSTPRSDHPPPPPHRWHDDAAPRVRLMCSFGGRILPRPHDNQLRYVGGDTRIVAVHRSTTFSSLLSKLSKLSGTCEVSVKYQLPHEDLDALISVTTDEDVENMMEEYDRLVHGGVVNTKSPRLRLFLFSPGEDTGGSGFGSVLEGSLSKRDTWFLDALNGGSGSLERGRSEVSSILSEVPDYLFGLDTNSDESKSKTRPFHENMYVSDPGSPALAMSSPHYCSASSTRSNPPIPDLPPVRIKPQSHEIAVEPEEQPQVQSMNPVWQYVHEPVPVYYVQGGSVPVRAVAMPVQYAHPVPQYPGQIPVGYRQPVQGVLTNPVHGGPVYIGGPSIGRGAYEYPAATAVEGYDVPAGGMMMNAPPYPTVGVPAGVEPPVTGAEIRMGRASQ